MSTSTPRPVADYVIGSILVLMALAVIWAGLSSCVLPCIGCPKPLPPDFVTPCGLRVFGVRGDDALMQLERDVDIAFRPVSGASTCTQLAGWKVFVGVPDAGASWPAFYSLPDAGVHFGHVAGQTNCEFRFISVAGVPWREGALVHEMMHAIDCPNRVLCGAAWDAIGRNAAIARVNNASVPVVPNLQGVSDG